MENSSSTHAAWLSLGVAAMVGATVAAASSYMVHCRAVKCLQSQRVLDVGDPRKRRVGPSRGRTNIDPLPGSSSTDGAQSAGPVRRQPGSLKPVLGVSSIRPSFPNSPVAGGSYESVEGSEEEDHLLPSNGEDNYNEDFEDDDSKSDMEAKKWWIRVGGWARETSIPQCRERSTESCCREIRLKLDTVAQYSWGSAWPSCPRSSSCGCSLQRARARNLC